MKGTIKLEKLVKLVIFTAVIASVGIVAGCRTNYYCVPTSDVAEYEKPIPFPAGFYMSEELRNEWFKTKGAFTRVDMPLGSVVFETAKARLKNAFTKDEDVDITSISSVPGSAFYTIAHESRRAEVGMLIKLQSLDFQFDAGVTECTMEFAVEDEKGENIIEKEYSSTGQKNGGVLWGGLGGDDEKITRGTEVALCNIYSQLLDDIREQVVPAMK